MVEYRNIKNVPQYVLGHGALAATRELLRACRQTRVAPSRSTVPIFVIDEFFGTGPGAAALAPLAIEVGDGVRFVSTVHEPTTDGVDHLMADLRAAGHTAPCVIVGMGGGTTLDIAKAIANLFTNPGRASDYQGWDLVQRPGIYKVGIPTISGTGAESSRTCVLTNRETGLKLGMNSDHTLYDQLVLDPDLPATVERNQYFYTGMDAYIHCVESLAGRYRNPIGDALSAQTLSLCRRVFLDGDMMSSENRERLMTASYLGGSAIATSFVGVVHPLSAGLSVVLGIHHCLANCIVMSVMEEFYLDAWTEFQAMLAAQDVVIPSGVCADATDDQIARMCAAAMLHEKPLANALGPDFRAILTPARAAKLFRRM